MTLALLLTAVTGAWAQGTLNVVEIEVPKAWETDNSNMTTADLTGFKASTLDEAKAWKGAPAEGYAMLIYAFDGDDAYYVGFNNGEPFSDHSPFQKNDVFANSNSMKFYYTAATGPKVAWDGCCPKPLKASSPAPTHRSSPRAPASWPSPERAPTSRRAR